MDVRDRVVVVTGGASGIGLALCRRFVAEGAATVVMADIAADLVPVAAAAGCVPAQLDVTSEVATVALVARVEAEHGPIELFCANAGVLALGGIEVPDDVWRRTFDVNLMAHVYAARALLPGWLARGRGHLLHTASAAGLLTGPNALPYAVSKHAVVALAEWLAIEHLDAGPTFSCLCPQGVLTPMMAAGGPRAQEQLGQGACTAEEVADCVVDGLAAGEFLILPHPEVARYERARVADRRRWLAGMARLRGQVIDAVSLR